MEFDFFNENGDGNEKEEKEVHRVPAPTVEAALPSRKPKRKWGKVVLSVFLAALLFCSGFLVCWATLDPEIRAIIGIKRKIQKEYYQDVSDEEFYRAIFGGINDSLDPYSEYMTAEEFEASQREMEGNREGIGLVFNTTNDELRISRVCGNSPAEEAGILAGETVVGYGATAEEITPCSDFDALSEFLSKYTGNQNFFLQIQSRAGETRTVQIWKSEYVENNVFYRTSSAAYTFLEGKKERGETMPYLPDDCAYIRLIQFTGKAASEFDAAMTQFKADGKKHLVLDLRGNGGGYLDIMQSISSYFCKNATETRPVVAVADYGKSTSNYRAYANVYAEYFAEDSRIFVLADSLSASASECLLGCMLDYGTISYGDICLAERGGVAKTYGKGIMQETFILNVFDQDAIKLTTAEIRWPTSKNSIHGRGILPEDGTMTVEENFDFEAETQSAILQCFSE